MRRSRLAACASSSGTAAASGRFFQKRTGISFFIIATFTRAGLKMDR